MVSMVGACIFAVVMSLAFYLESQDSNPESRPDPLFLVIPSTFALTQVLAGVSRLLHEYESQRTFARRMQLAAVLGAVACVLLLAVILIF